jgi:Arc/MetJ-type ribon-helix-helix transcriptional regulator
MPDRSPDMEEVTVEFEEEVLEDIDRKAFRDHRDNRAAAIRDLLDEWLKSRDRNRDRDSDRD